MEFGGLTCRGTESTLQECSVSSAFVEVFSDLFFSNQRDYSGVKCIPRSTCTGTPQISIEKTFSVCNTFTSIKFCTFLTVVICYGI